MTASLTDPGSAGVILFGAGAFGSAFASVLRRQGVVCELVGRGGPTLTALCGRGLPVILAVPAQAHAALLADLSIEAGEHRPELWTLAKGIDLASGQLLPELAAARGLSLGVISGPSFAEDLQAGRPTALNIAGPQAERRAQDWSGAVLRLYPLADRSSVALAGAMKNVIAIACGACDGLALGASARSALMARGLAEIARLARALGGDPQTLLDLAGVGDLALSAHSPLSRNYRLGCALGEGRSAEGVLAEGAATARAALKRATQVGCELPITQAVVALLDGVSAEVLMRQLLDRPLASPRLEPPGG